MSTPLSRNTYPGKFPYRDMPSQGIQARATAQRRLFQARYQLFRAVLIAASLSAFASDAWASDAPVPKSVELSGELKAVIAQVHDAAIRQDFPALRSHMIDAFTWSFGGDDSAEQAIADWQADTKTLTTLASVTKAKCGAIKQGIVQCPIKAGMQFRAGFQRVGGQWKMVYFVAGD